MFTADGDLEIVDNGLTNNQGLYDIGKLDQGFEVFIAAIADGFESNTKSVQVGSDDMTALIPMIPVKHGDKNIPLTLFLNLQAYRK